MIKKLLIYTLMLSFPLLQSTGNFNLYSIARTSDQSIIKIPFRMFNLRYSYDHDRFSISSNFSLEYDVNFETSDSDYLLNSSPKDRIWKVDLREIYFTWFLESGEIRVGKQLFAWGMVDENSPIDNANAFDYFYLFETGTDRKLGSYSLAVDYSLGEYSLSAVVSPYHSTSRLPLGDSEFPIKVPLYPDPDQIVVKDTSPLEFGGYIQKGFDSGDVQISYFSGLDRIFSLSAISTWSQPEFVDQENVHSVISYTYRRTSVFGLGFNYFLNDLTLRGDLGLFSTRDMNDNLRVKIRREDFPEAFEVEQVDGAVPEHCVPDDFDGNNFNDECYLLTYTEYVEENSSSLEEQADYYQMTLQLEYGLPFDITFGAQYFKWDVVKYSANKLGVTIDDLKNIPALEGSPILSMPSIDPEILFSPGLGTPNAVLSKELFIFSGERRFLDESLKISLLTMVDLQNLDQDVIGSITSLTAEYSLTDDWICLLGFTSIKGDSSMPFYRFNEMEDFSHVRLQLKYFF